jgi:hypothetical protein
VNLGDDEATSEKLYEIAEYIKSLCDKMKVRGDQLFGDCKAFCFPQPHASPGPDAIQAPPLQPFPGR